ncbi:hypothetical protein OGAPHI_006394 [Ogataea philodendri]|uniref:Uncharacterized protein n=1 Tax=Ogataea philodendri TaxID=1378263 RepID=A0A9P8T0K7_9ASCO|nr:uncharacterized protein OGAPHI_006394 [Ogataea philodendri]KAH3661546.1 hypothetical protein OGAPHI_006394 [Ogataea philodendri]
MDRFLEYSLQSCWHNFLCLKNASRVQSPDGGGGSSKVSWNFGISKNSSPVFQASIITLRTSLLTVHAVKPKLFKACKTLSIFPCDAAVFA